MSSRSFDSYQSGRTAVRPYKGIDLSNLVTAFDNTLRGNEECVGRAA